MAAGEALTEIKAKQQQTWSSGDYGKIAWLTVPLGDILCDAVDVRPGARVLDVATGTGHVAHAAARRFCTVTGIDYVPSLLDIARRRADAEGLTVDFREADAERLPFDDGEFDYVLSALGVMFTADHRQAASELVRVCRSGGRIGLVSWTPAGFVGQLLATVGRHAPPPAGTPSPMAWGTADTVRDLLGDGVTELVCETGTIAQRFLSPDHFVDFFLTYYGPTLKAAQRLTEEGRAALREDLVAAATSANRASDGVVVCDWEYLVAVATTA